MSREAMKLALEYLEESDNYLGSLDHSKPIAALREALAQPEEKYTYGTPLLDAMKPDFWEGYVPEPDKRQQALDKKAENARELGLDYEPVPENFMDALRFDVAMRDAAQPAPVQEPVAQYSDIVSDGGLDPRNKFDIPAAQRQWVGLTDEEKETLSYKANGNTWAAVELAEAKSKEKNT
jgi:hypothetical protein